ncbi:MAG: outer membrane protein transport protein [Bacteroidales bacterium]|nr:outer membrane protein transport protein [Bacteroidales bacterium]
MKKILLLPSLFLLFSVNLYAQNEVDALLLSQNVATGSARVTGMGGASGAMGADPSVMAWNPAGLGLYRSGEFSLTPGILFQSDKNSFSGYSATENKARFILNTASYVSTIHLSPGKTLNSVTFGFGYNQVADFTRRMRVVGSGLQTSLLDSWAADASGWGNSADYISPDDLDTYSPSGMAYNQFLITDNVDFYQSELEYAGYGQSLNRTRYTSGGIGEWDFSVAGNFMDQVYLGLTVGIQNIRYDETMDHYETGGQSLIDHFRYMEDYYINGSGVNIKAGMIYRPIDMLRIGLSYHSPTWMNLSNGYNNGLMSGWTDYAFEDQTALNYETYNDPTYYDFKFRTPGKVMASATLQFGQLGLINLDYEYIDYAGMKYKSDNGYDQLYYDMINSSIDNMYQGVSNVRVGGELKLNPVMSLRAGYGYYGNPYRSSLYNDYSYQTVSAGWGMRTESFYLDLAYMHTFRDEFYWMYEAPDIASYSWDAVSHGSSVKGCVGRFLATVGFRF